MHEQLGNDRRWIVSRIARAEERKDKRARDDSFRFRNGERNERIVDRRVRIGSTSDILDAKNPTNLGG